MRSQGHRSATYRDAGQVFSRAGHGARFSREEDRFIVAKSKEGLTPQQIAKIMQPPRKHNSILGRLATLARYEERRQLQLEAAD